MSDLAEYNKLTKEYKEMFGESFYSYGHSDCLEVIRNCIKTKTKQKKEPYPSNEEIQELQEQYKKKFGKYYSFFEKGENIDYVNNYKEKHILLRELSKI